MEVSRIVLHREYNSSNYRNDIALLKLNKDAEYTKHVRPVCLWKGSNNLEQLVNKLGKCYFITCTNFNSGLDSRKQLIELLIIRANFVLPQTLKKTNVLNEKM